MVAMVVRTVFMGWHFRVTDLRRPVLAFIHGGNTGFLQVWTVLVLAGQSEAPELRRMTLKFGIFQGLTFGVRSGRDFAFCS